MSYGAKEARINQERKPRVNLCGSCGKRVKETELLCAACRKTPQTQPDDGGFATWVPSGNRF
jgi:hypothetical protein